MLKLAAEFAGTTGSLTVEPSGQSGLVHLTALASGPSEMGLRWEVPGDLQSPTRVQDVPKALARALRIKSDDIRFEQGEDGGLSLLKGGYTLTLNTQPTSSRAEVFPHGYDPARNLRVTGLTELLPSLLSATHDDPSLPDLLGVALSGAGEVAATDRYQLQWGRVTVEGGELGFDADKWAVIPHRFLKLLLPHLHGDHVSLQVLEPGGPLQELKPNGPNGSEGSRIIVVELPGLGVAWVQTRPIGSYVNYWRLLPEQWQLEFTADAADIVRDVGVIGASRVKGVYLDNILFTVEDGRLTLSSGVGSGPTRPVEVTNDYVNGRVEFRLRPDLLLTSIPKKGPVTFRFSEPMKPIGVGTDRIVMPGKEPSK